MEFSQCFPIWNKLTADHQARVRSVTDLQRIPKGTVVRLNAGVWHKDSFAVEQDEVHTMICLPERTYKRDCVILPYGEENWIEIEK